jgi:hypothetical protein
VAAPAALVRYEGAVRLRRAYYGRAKVRAFHVGGLCRWLANESEHPTLRDLGRDLLAAGCDRLSLDGLPPAAALRCVLFQLRCHRGRRPGERLDLLVGIDLYARALDAL